LSHQHPLPSSLLPRAADHASGRDSVQRRCVRGWFSRRSAVSRRLSKPCPCHTYGLSPTYARGCQRAPHRCQSKTTARRSSAPSLCQFRCGLRCMLRRRGNQGAECYLTLGCDAARRYHTISHTVGHSDLPTGQSDELNHTLPCCACQPISGGNHLLTQTRDRRWSVFPHARRTANQRISIALQCRTVSTSYLYNSAPLRSSTAL